MKKAVAHKEGVMAAPSTSSAAGDIPPQSPADFFMWALEERVARIEAALGLPIEPHPLKGPQKFYDEYQYKKAIRAMALFQDTKPLKKYLEAGGIIPTGDDSGAAGVSRRRRTLCRYRQDNRRYRNG